MVEIAKIGSDFQVSSETEGDQLYSSVTGIASGRFVVTWTDSSRTLGDASGSSIKAQIFDASGAKKGAEFLVNTVTDENQIAPRVTELSNSNFVITWYDTQYPPGASEPAVEIKAQIFNQSGAKVGEEFFVNFSTPSVQNSPTISALNDGGFVVSWTDYSGASGGASTGIEARIFDAGGVARGGDLQVNTQTFGEQSAQEVTALANGGFVITWHDFSGTLGDSSERSIKAQVFDEDGAKVGSEFLVNTATVAGQASPYIHALASGGFVIAWTDFSDAGLTPDSNIKAQFFNDIGEKQGGEFKVNTVKGANGAQIVGTQNDGFVVAYNGAGGGMAQAFDASGAKLGSEVLITAHQIDAIAALENGRFVVTLQTDNLQDSEDPSGTSIRAQILTVGTAPVINSNGGRASVSLALPENGTAVTTVQAADPDAGTTLTYSISGGADAARFQINAITGALSFITPPNFEAPADVGANNVYNVIVKASDGTLFDTQAIAITVTDARDSFAGTALADTLTGTNGRDTIFGAGGNDTLNGLGGADVIDGGDDADSMFGGAGDDFYFVDNLGDKVIERWKEGYDTVHSSVSFKLAGTYIEMLVLTGANATSATGNSKANILIGNNAANVLNGLGGADSMDGARGNDTYYVDNAGDRTVERVGGGIDTVMSSVDFSLGTFLYIEKLVLTGANALSATGNSQGNALIGNNAANALSALGGADTLDGRGGADTLAGGAGQDTFAFGTALGLGNIDTISDFSVADDTIQLSATIFGGLSGGRLAASAFFIGEGAATGDHRIVYNSVSGALSFDADGTGSSAAVQFATLAPGLALTYADFVVV